MLDKDDLINVFSRFGKLFSVNIDRFAAIANIIFEDPLEASLACLYLNWRYLPQENAFLSVKIINNVDRS